MYSVTAEIVQRPHHHFLLTQVAFEASPITTLLEKDVGSQMCKMLGYDTYIKPEPGNAKPEPKKVVSWGHIACDGTIANMESMW